jgi:putative ABC transport system permease protein
MTLIIMVLRKMHKNKGFIFFLMIGLLISTALMSSIPMYTDGVLQKVFVKDMENYQKDGNTYPGGFKISLNAQDSSLNNVLRGVKEDNIFKNDKVKQFYKQYQEDFNKIDDYSKNKIASTISLPSQEIVITYSTEPRRFIHDNFKAGDFDDGGYSRIQAISDMDKHIRLLDGRLPSKSTVDGVYEVLVSEGALENLKFGLDRVYVMSDVNKKGYADIKIKPVGVFSPKVNDDMYWTAFKIENFDDAVIIDENLMMKDFINSSPTQLDSASWYFALDYHALKLGNINKFYLSEKTIEKDLVDIRNSVGISFPLMDLTQNYLAKENQLKTMMWSLNVPVIIMLSIYLFMVSKLIIDKEKNEISLLISRGASRIQIVFGYVVEGLMLSIIALIFGPLLGRFLTELLGASNGFMEFVDRKALDISINFTSYGYAALACLIFLVTLLIPAYKAGNTSIVDHKRKKARGTEKVFWEKVFLDVILLGISAYGFYVFNQRQNILKATAVAGKDIQIDPILFFVPVLFILGTSLLCLRLYPLLLKLIYKLGKKLWPPSMYGTLVQVSRSASNYHFLMVFIMLTLSIGIFSSTAARTINKNAEDKILYKDGTDIVIQPVWEKVESGGIVSAPGEPQSKNKNNSEPVKATINYIEPPFGPYETLPGVEHTAKVFNRNNVSVQAGKNNISDINLMAIEPYDFGNVTYQINGLLPHHINEYLNLLSAEESSCIISKAVSDTTGAKIGDSINVTWDGNNQVIFNVYAIVDYWPTNTPNINTKERSTDPKFIVTNLSYVQSNFPKEPYSVWLKLKNVTSREQLYKSIRENKDILLSGFLDTNTDIINLKTNPSQLAINGSLTMGFIISVIICFLGFILYWILSLKERNLQFGVLRAIGLSAMQLKLMMIWEQVLTSGVAMVVGTFIGLLCSKLYVVFFQISTSYAEQIPPFRVISYLSDRIKVYGFMGFTFLLGIGILIYLLSKIKISNVIKLGED